MSTCADHLLAALSTSVGLPELAFDAEDRCTLAFDGLQVNLEIDEAAGLLFLYADICALAVDAPVATLETLLAANLFWRGAGGATLSLEPESRRVVLARGLTVDAVSETVFLSEVERFVAAAEMWAARLAAPAHAPVDDALDAPDATSSVPLQWTAV